MTSNAKYYYLASQKPRTFCLWQSVLNSRSDLPDSRKWTFVKPWTTAAQWTAHGISFGGWPETKILCSLNIFYPRIWVIQHFWLILARLICRKFNFAWIDFTGRMTEDGSLLHKALEAEDSQFYTYDSTELLGHLESAFFNQFCV